MVVVVEKVTVVEVVVVVVKVVVVAKVEVFVVVVVKVNVEVNVVVAVVFGVIVVADVIEVDGTGFAPVVILFIRAEFSATVLSATTASVLRGVNVDDRLFSESTVDKVAFSHKFAAPDTVVKSQKSFQA